MEIFEAGQEFEGDYPPEAAAWCNANGCAIEETTPEGAGERTFRIVPAPDIVVEAPPDPAPSREELAAAVAGLGDLLAAQEAANAEVLAALAEIGDAVAALAGEE